MQTDATGLILWGPVGTGKTYIAAHIANALLDRAAPVMITSMGKLIAGMPGVIGENQNEYIQNLNAFDLLIIDDLGTERDAEYAFEKFYSIIAARCRAHLPIIFTTIRILEDLRQPKQLNKQRIDCCVLERWVPLNVNRRAIREKKQPPPSGRHRRFSTPAGNRWVCHTIQPFSFVKYDLTLAI